MSAIKPPALLILNQMAGPMTWELAEDLGRALGSVALLTGHPDTLAKGSTAAVWLFPASPYERGSFGRRVITWLRYITQAFQWIYHWPPTVPLLLFSNPPMLCWLGYLMHKLRGQPYLVMVHDIYPDLIVRLGHLSAENPLVLAWRWLNRRSYQSASIVMTLGESMAAMLARQFDPSCTVAGNIKVIPPWADTNVIKPLPKKHNWFAHQYGQVDKLTVMYSGNMGLGHDIDSMLGAARLLQKDTGVHFMFIGAGPKWQFLADSLEREHLPNVTLLGWQPEEVLPFSLATADVALVSLEDSVEGLALPSKAFSFLAAGASLAVIADHASELAAIIGRFQCGWTVHPGQPEALAAILRNLLVHPGYLIEAKAHSRAAAQAIGSRRNSECFIEALSYVRE